MFKSSRRNKAEGRLDKVGAWVLRNAGPDRRAHVTQAKGNGRAHAWFRTENDRVG